MREKDLYRKVDKLIPTTVHRQSMTGSAMTANGTPDRYYDGTKRDLWVEYKMLSNMPRSHYVVGKYTALQYQWMDRRYATGKNVIGVVGLPDGTAVIQTTPEEWHEGVSIFARKAVKEVSAWICDFCGV